MENWIIKIVDKGWKIGRDIYIFRGANGNGTGYIMGVLASKYNTL